jgi:hypothetical protein
MSHSFSIPRNKNKLKQFIGYANYWLCHTNKNFGTMCRPIFQLLRELDNTKTDSITWTDDLQASFNSLCDAIISVQT